MRLFLSSENFGKYSDVLIDLVGKNRKVAYIANAKDYYSDDQRSAMVSEHKERFETLGFTFIEFDLRDNFNEHLPEDALDGFGLVWCSGGNTFLLNYAMVKSGFNDILTSYVRKDLLVYGGSSAGSILATPSLHGTEYGDDPQEVARIYNDKITWDALSLVPFYIAPHCNSADFGEAAAKMVDYFKTASLDYYAVEDGQVVFVRDEAVEHLQ